MATEHQTQIENDYIALASRPDGKPSKENFESKSETLTSPDAGQFLVKNQWMSVDPYMRGRMSEGESYVAPFQIGEPLEGGCVGEVVESRNDQFSEGDLVLGNAGWRRYWKSDGQGVQKIDAELAPPETFLGPLGMTGMTAWVGLKQIAKLESGSTVFVSAASGAVGSAVCQIAKAHDCRVIGSAGKQEKIDWLRDQAGIKSVINYKTTSSLVDELAEHAPNGIDVYFDNVGGSHLEAALDQMNDFGCIVSCGMISTYNATEPPAAPRNLFQIITKRLRMQGFIVRDHMDEYEAFIKELSALIRNDQFVWETTITEGLANAPEAFIGLFDGDNLGKAVVRID